MENSRLIEILRVFNKKEVRNLRKWVVSPIGNQREDVIFLFEYLLKNERYQENNGLLKTDIFKQVYPELRYDDAKMRQLVFFCMKTLEEFIAYTELRKDEINAKMALANFYRTRNLEKPYLKNYKQLNSLHESQPYRNSEYLRKEYLILKESYEFSVRNSRTKKINLLEVSESLYHSFIVDQLRQGCLMHAYRSFYETDYKIGLIDEIIDEIVKKPVLLEIPAISVYFHGYKTNLEKENPIHFENLKDAMKKFEPLFPMDEFGDIYHIAINHCIGQMNRGEDAFIRESFEMYKQGFDNEILIDNNIVSRWTFLNVILIALKLHEYNWVEKFINEKQIYLEEKYRESFINISFATFYYQKRDFSKAMSYLLQYEHDDITINLRAKNILLKIYYEEGEISTLESLLGSMRTYLSRKKVMGYHKDNFKNIIRLIKKLLKITPYGKEQKIKLKTLIQEANPLTTDDRNWLLTQLENI